MRRFPPPLPRRLGTVVPATLLAAALAWASAWLVVELDAVRRQVALPPNPGAVAEWTLATPRAESLQRFLHAARTRLPPNRVVAFTAGSPQPDQEFFLALWAAYLLPDQRVLRLAGTPRQSGAEYLLAYGVELADPYLEEVLRHPSGTLYRVRVGGGDADGDTGSGDTVGAGGTVGAGDTVETGAAMGAGDGRQARTKPEGVPPSPAAGETTAASADRTAEAPR